MFGAFRATARKAFRQTAQSRGGHDGGPAFHGFKPPYVAPVHKNMGEIMMGVMWSVQLLLLFLLLFFSVLSSCAYKSLIFIILCMRCVASFWISGFGFFTEQKRMAWQYW